MKTNRIIILLVALTAGLSARAQGTFKNPVIAVNWPDPTVWESEGTYYSVATGLNTLRKSTDMVNWTDTGLSPITDEARERLLSVSKSIWAPCVTKIKGKWVLYVSLYVDDDHCSIAVMNSDRPDGPFEWRGILLDGVPDCGVANAIDPFTIETDGKVYHFFGSLEDGIHVIELTGDGLALKEGAEAKHLAGIRHPKQKFVKEAYEGTYIMKRGNWWYFFASGGAYYDGTYHLVVARSKEITGPYFDREGNPFTEGKALPILSSKPGDHFIGPGHNGDVFVTKGGRTYMFFHSHATDFPDSARPTLLQQVLWDAEDWPYFKNGSPAETETMP